MPITALKPPANLIKPPIKAPRHLRREGKALWLSVAETFYLEPHDIALLTALCETLDRKNKAEKELHKAGELTFENRHHELKPHPCIAIARDCGVLMARLRRELNLSEAVPESRPTRLKYGGKK